MEQVYWRYEDQLNSCVGQIDENGWRTMQNSYLAFGEVMQSRVLYDGAVSRLSAVEYDGLALTTITLANNDLSTYLLNVEVWQIYFGGAKPSKLSGSHNDKIRRGR